MLFESNLVYRVKTGAIHQHYGRDNVFRNNILAYSMENMVQRSRLEDHRTITVEGNILYWDNSTAAVTGGRKAPGVAPDMAFARNLYWSTAGVATNAFLGVPFAAWQAAGQDEGSRIADPLFADPAKGDFDLRADSPAFMLGFRAFDWRRAGVRGDASWRAEAAACDPGEVRFAPPPRPVEPSCSRAGVDFERFGASGGRGPAFFRLSIGRSKEAHIRPTDRHAHSGRWSLELKDSPDLAAPYQPHLYRFMTAKDGVVQISFAMKCGAGAVVHFLLRDYHPEEGGEYAGGPGFRAEHGRVLAGGETVAFAPGTWLTADVRLDFKTRTWTLVLTPDGGKATSVGPLDFPKHFVRLDWIGFTTDAPDAATWWLDDFTYSHDAMEE